jgi:hypothetical protein
VVEVRELRPSDVFAVIADLRPADVDEVSALVGADNVMGAVETSIDSSSLAWTLTDDGLPIAVFGVAPTEDPRVGVPWMVGTPGVVRRQRAFMRLCKDYIPRMLALFPVLVNVVDARNERAIAWLRHVGFVFGPPALAGVEHRLFYPFRLEAAECAS